MKLRLRNSLALSAMLIIACGCGKKEASAPTASPAPPKPSAPISEPAPAQPEAAAVNEAARTMEKETAGAATQVEQAGEAMAVEREAAAEAVDTVATAVQNKFAEIFAAINKLIADGDTAGAAAAIQTALKAPDLSGQQRDTLTTLLEQVKQQAAAVATKAAAEETKNAVDKAAGDATKAAGGLLKR